jgi:hypothetical protein
MHLGAKIVKDEEFDQLEDAKEILEQEQQEQEQQEQEQEQQEQPEKKEEPKKKCRFHVNNGCKFEAHEQEELDKHAKTCQYRLVICYYCKNWASLWSINDGNHQHACKGFRCLSDKSFKCSGSTTGLVQPGLKNSFGEINHDDKLFHVFVDRVKGVYVRFDGTPKEALGYVAKIKYVTHIEHEEMFQVLPYDLSDADFETSTTKHKSGFTDACTNNLKDTTIAVTIKNIVK